MSSSTYRYGKSGNDRNCHVMCVMLFMSRNLSHKDKCSSHIVRQVMLVERVACASRNVSQTMYCTYRCKLKSDVIHVQSMNI